MTVTCKYCGEVWAEDPALGVACPVCDAPPHTYCANHRPSGHRVKFGSWIHPERDGLAFELGLITRCPGKRKETDEQENEANPARAAA
jgi:hypothetical protein